MYSVLIVLMVIVSVLMCLIVLIQESKGGGLASSFASSNQIMGVRKTTDVIEKATWALAIVMVLISVSSTYVSPKEAEKPIMENATSLPAAPAATQQNASQLPTTPQQ